MSITLQPGLVEMLGRGDCLLTPLFKTSQAVTASRHSPANGFLLTAPFLFPPGCPHPSDCLHLPFSRCSQVQLPTCSCKGQVWLSLLLCLSAPSALMVSESSKPKLPFKEATEVLRSSKPCQGHTGVRAGFQEMVVVTLKFMLSPNTKPPP